VGGSKQFQLRRGKSRGECAGRWLARQRYSPRPRYSGGEGLGVRGQVFAKSVPLTPDPLPPEYRGERGERQGPARALECEDRIPSCPRASRAVLVRPAQKIWFLPDEASFIACHRLSLCVLWGSLHSL